MIPRVIHQIWVGGEPPDWVERSWANWRAVLPEDWELRLWLDEDVKKDSFLNAWASFPDVDPRGLSNLLRVQILLLHGGIYTDVDCLPIGDLGPLAGDVRSWIGAIYGDSRKQLTNSCFGFKPSHPFLMDVLQEGAANLMKGLSADFFLAGSRTFRTVYNQGEYDLDLRWDYMGTGHVEARKALADISGADLDWLRASYGPFPIVHVWKPRL